MMISCRKATELICQSMDRPLGRWERVQLRFHLLMCRGCNGFMEQSRRLDALIRKHFQELDTDQLEAEAAGLSPDACERMKRKLHEALNARGHGHKGEGPDANA